MFNTTALLNVLPRATEAWLDVFAVTIIIIAATYIMNKFTSGKKEK